MAAEYIPNLLIVDDSQLVRELMRETFVDAGYAVITAANGQEALERVSEDRPDLIISDVEMPIMDGWKLCESIKADPQYRDVPFVFLADQREVADRVRGLRMGAYDYLVKPFAPEEILLRMRIILERIRRGAAAGEAPRSYLSGHTSHMPVPDLVQMLSMNLKTGCLRVRTETSLGRIYLRKGQIVGAFSPRARGDKALARIICWRDADFHFDPVDDEHVDFDLGGNTQRLLMDALVVSDDLARLKDRMPSTLVPLAPTEEGRRQLEGETLTLLQRRVLRHANERTTLRDLMDELEESDSEIVETIIELMDRGALTQHHPSHAAV